MLEVPNIGICKYHGLLWCSYKSLTALKKLTELKMPIFNVRSGMALCQNLAALLYKTRSFKFMYKHIFARKFFSTEK